VFHKTLLEPVVFRLGDQWDTGLDLLHLDFLYRTKVMNQSRLFSSDILSCSTTWSRDPNIRMMHQGSCILDRA
jgi:hypothetical protein